MQSLQQFIINAFEINEHKQDMMPRCIVMMGGPGAGKTWWMNNDAKQFFPEMKQYKKLDSDHNLEQVQRKHMKEIADALFMICTNKTWDDAKIESEFDKYIDKKQEEMDAICKENNSPTVNLSIIEKEYVMQKAKEFNTIPPKEQKNFLYQYNREFHEMYWKEIFASDFSKRPVSKAAYYKTYYKKLSGLAEDDFKALGEDEAFCRDLDDTLEETPADVVLAICGDELKDFKKVVNTCRGRYSIYVVFLDIPLELSIERDAKRDRSVGPTMCKKKIEGCRKTWQELKDEQENLGIWQMYRFEWHDDLKPKSGWGKPVESITNMQMLRAK